ncbi:MAG TPA: sialidase family protein [Longimicrobium sp.]
MLAVDRGGTLHALWGEHEAGAERAVDSASQGPGSAVQFSLGRVLYARYRNGRWTRAQVVYRGQVVSWHRSLLSRLVEDAGGNLHIALVAKPKSAHALVHLRLGRDGWRTTEWVGERRFRRDPAPGDNSLIPAIGGFYPSLAVGQGGRIYVAFASPALRASGRPIPGGDVNSVWVRRSDDAGLTWSAPVLVHLSGRAGGYELQILARGRDSVHLLWRKQAGQQRGADEIPHAVSADGGVTWRSAGKVPVQGSNPVRHLRAVATSKGEMYIAFTQQPETGTTPEERRRRLDTDQIFYSHLGASGWSVPRPLRPEVGVFPFDLRIDEADRLHLLWGFTAPDSAGGAPRRVLSYAIAAPCVVDRR